MTARERDYQDGFDAGMRDGAICSSAADVQWYQSVVYGNLWDDRPHYIAGYLDGSSRATGGGSWR